METFAPPPPPRGVAHYDKGRGRQIGFGCLVVLFIVGAGAGLLLVALGLSSNNDFVPDGTLPPGTTATTSSPADSGAPPAEAE